MGSKEMTNSWTIKLIEDPKTGDLILPLTSDILNQVGWDEGDTLLWEELPSGSWSLTKKEEKNGNKDTGDST
jgi:hypothetical protein